VTTFWHPSAGAYICQMPSHRLTQLAKGTPLEIGFPSVPLVWVKLQSLAVGCAQDSRRQGGSRTSCKPVLDRPWSKVP